MNVFGWSSGWPVPETGGRTWRRQLGDSHVYMWVPDGIDETLVLAVVAQELEDLRDIYS